MQIVVCACFLRERGRRGGVFSLFPQHQLCGFYEEQMFTTWYSASSPSTHYLQCQHHQLSARTHTPTHIHTYIICTESESPSHIDFFVLIWGVFTCASWIFLFFSYVRFSLCSRYTSCSWVNTWFNQVSLPLWQFVLLLVRCDHVLLTVHRHSSSRNLHVCFLPLTLHS